MVVDRLISRRIAITQLLIEGPASSYNALRIPMSDNLAIFISYSHEEEERKNFVVSQTKVAEHQSVFDVRDERRIKMGED